MSIPPRTTSITICALTYLRPIGLTRMLEGLETLELPHDVTADVLIVDNDPEASARELVERHGRTSRLPTRYVCEPARGISAARNRAVREAADADFVMFIDDDEWPEPNWLSEMLTVQRECAADVVTGPVVPVFEGSVPEWIVDGGFFERRRFADRADIRFATTSSVLIANAALRARAEPFNARFGLSGGSDTLLFAQMREEERRRFVWSEQAVVYESIPPTRARAQWILKREYRRGNTLSLVLRELDPNAARIARRAAHGLIEIARGSFETLVGLFGGRAKTMLGLERICLGAGMLAGLTGLRYQEYRTVHGK